MTLTMPPLSAAPGRGAQPDLHEQAIKPNASSLSWVRRNTSQYKSRWWLRKVLTCLSEITSCRPLAHSY